MKIICLGSLLLVLCFTIAKANNITSFLEVGTFSDPDLQRYYGPSCFHCTENHSEVVINKITYQCAKDKVCNRFNTNSWHPCIEKTKVCEHIFTCADPQNEANNIFTFRDTSLKCPPKRFCNNKPTDNCDFCVEKKCTGHMDYKCDSNLNYFWFGQMQLRCPDRSQCNDGFIPPCSPCLYEDGTAATSLAIQRILSKAL